jgi:hypothetical protein
MRVKRFFYNSLIGPPADRPKIIGRMGRMEAEPSASGGATGLELPLTPKASRNRGPPAALPASQCQRRTPARNSERGGYNYHDFVIIPTGSAQAASFRCLPDRFAMTCIRPVAASWRFPDAWRTIGGGRNMRIPRSDNVNSSPAALRSRRMPFRPVFRREQT